MASSFARVPRQALRLCRSNGRGQTPFTSPPLRNYPASASQSRFFSQRASLRQEPPSKDGAAATPATAAPQAPPSNVAPSENFPSEVALIAPELQEIFPLIPKEDREMLLSEARAHFDTLPSAERQRLAVEAADLRNRLVSRFGALAGDPTTVLEPSAQSTALMNTFLAHIRPARAQGLFALDEVDANTIGSDEKFENDDISPLAHAELERQREIREYARWTVWELPLLSKFAKEYTPPSRNEILRFKYTRVLGEAHPSDKKVVLEFCVADLTTELPEKAQRDKLIKLVGPRYNPETDIVRMSSDSYETPAQNKQRLLTVLQRLFDEVRDAKADSFEDLPMDFRHHKAKKTRAKFPTEWIMTPERRKQLDGVWQSS